MSRILFLCALAAALAHPLAAQQPAGAAAEDDGARGRAAAGGAGDTTRSPAAADTPTAARVAPEAYLMVDTIIVVEDVKGLVWGDWYVNPEVGRQIAAAIERDGRLSGRTWLESAAPIRDLALGPPEDGTQAITFVDKGVALDFWEPSEVNYRYAFEGPWGLRSTGVAKSCTDGSEGRLAVRLPIREPPDRGALEPRRRVGRLDIVYEPRGRREGPPRGRFTIYFYYLNARLGYRIAGVGY